MDIIKLDELEIKEDEFETAAALIRGIIKKFVDLGYSVGGFDAYTVSNVLKVRDCPRQQLLRYL